MVDKHVILALINLSDIMPQEIIEKNIVNRLMDLILENGIEKNPLFPLYIILLSNITRHEKGARKLLSLDDPSMTYYYMIKLIPLLFKKDDNDIINKKEEKNNDDDDDESKNKTHHEWVLNLFNNISQLKEGRIFILERKDVFRKILDNVNSDKLIRRRSALGTISNCLFESDYHEKILKDFNDDDDENDHFISTILYPIMKYDYDIDDDDKKSIPKRLIDDIDKNKEVEKDVECRSLIIDILILLTGTRYGRDYMKKKNVYQIVRELDKIEESESISNKIYELIHFLVLDDPEESDKKEEEKKKRIEEEKKKIVDVDECGDPIEEI